MNIKEVVMPRWFVFFLLLFWLICGVGMEGRAQGYGPDELDSSDKTRWATLSGGEAGAMLLRFREQMDTEGFANHFVLFLDQGRETPQIMDMLRVLGLPLQPDEVEAIGEICQDTPLQVHHRNCVFNGYHLDFHLTPGPRLQLTFLNDEERQVYRKWQMREGKIETKREEQVAADLEGRMCVWANDRKIHLGGPHFVPDRVIRILTRTGNKPKYDSDAGDRRR